MNFIIAFIEDTTALPATGNQVYQIGIIADKLTELNF